MSRGRAQVAEAVDAISIRDDLHYAWLGRRGRPLPAAVREALDAPARRAHLRECLSQELYWSFYCRGEVVPARWGEPQPVSADPSLVRSLTVANAGGERWEDGWEVEREEAGAVVVKYGRLRVRASASACRGVLEPGRRVAVRVPSERSSLSPGFVVMGPSTSMEGLVVRLYWHVVARGAAALVGALTSVLAGTAVPYRLKVLDHPLRFDRCDAAVLYLPAAAFPGLRASLAGVAADVSRVLRPKIPAFTLPLASGVGLAEDAGTRESFGEQRCAMLADGLIDAFAHGATTRVARTEFVLERLARSGVDVDLLHRHPGQGEHVL